MSSIALLFSHHILSSKKIQAIQKLSTLNDLTTVLKVGKPGLIIMEGPTPAVEQTSSTIMKMKWQYITLRACVPTTRPGLENHFGTGCTVIHKMSVVGQVMRRTGYEDFYKSAIMK